MFTYGFVPFAIMFVCSIIIIRKIHNAKKTPSPKSEKTQTESFYQNLKSIKRNSLSLSYQMANRPRINSISKEKQVTSILLVTNFLFIFLVSPILVMNILNMLQDDTLRTTIAYFLCYANHGYLKKHFTKIKLQNYN